MIIKLIGYTKYEYKFKNCIFSTLIFWNKKYSNHYKDFIQVNYKNFQKYKIIIYAEICVTSILKSTKCVHPVKNAK